MPSRRTINGAPVYIVLYAFCPGLANGQIPASKTSFADMVNTNRAMS